MSKLTGNTEGEQTKPQQGAVPERKLNRPLTPSTDNIFEIVA